MNGIVFVQIQEDLKQGKQYPFSEVIQCNIGNPQVNNLFASCMINFHDGTTCPNCAIFLLMRCRWLSLEGFEAKAHDLQPRRARSRSGASSHGAHRAGNHFLYP